MATRKAAAASSTGAPLEAPVSEQVDVTAEEVTEAAAPVDLIGKVVSWAGHDAWGNPRRLFGIVAGPHPWDEGLAVAPLVVDQQQGYAPDDLTVLGS